MKVSFGPAPLGLMIIGAAALIGAAAPAQAEGSTASPFTPVEGLVTAAADAATGVPATLTIHSAYDGDVVLTVDPNTHFRKAGGEQEPPVAMPGGVEPQAASSPSLAGFVGLFARATYDPNSHVALNLFLGQPEPESVSGVVDSASATDLVLDVKGRGKLDLSPGPQTCVRLDGLPSGGDKLVAGDLANVLFWPAATDNEALRVDARTPPPVQFQGVLTGLLTADGAVVGFTAARGSTPMSFQDSSTTQFTLDGKPAAPADLQNGDTVRVLYRNNGDVNDALQVTAFTPPVVNRHRTGEHHGTGDPSGGSTGTPGPTGSPTPNSDGGQSNRRLARPRVVGGQVGSVDTTGNTFTLTSDGKTLTFSVDANTSFQVNDKPAAFADLQANQQVYVVYQATATGNLALKVLIRQPATQPGGTGDAQP